MWELILLTQIAVTVMIHRRFRPPTAALLCAWYTILLEVSFWADANGLYSGYIQNSVYDPARTHFSGTLELYLSLWALAIFSVAPLRPQRSAGIANTIDNALKRASKSRWIAWASGAIYIVTIVNLLSFRMDVVLKNHEYLLMGSASAYTVSPMYALVLATGLNICGILAVAFLAIYFTTGRKGRALLLFPAATFIYLLQLSAHSRYSAVYVFVFFAVIVSSRVRGKMILSVLTLAALLFSLTYSLQGRSFGLNGLATIGDNLERMEFSGSADALQEVLLNLTQGVFVTGDSLVINTEIDKRYQFLSFSPLPSFLDGFRPILECCQVRVGAYEPMSAVGEISHFDLGYQIFSAVTFFLLLFHAARAWIRRPGTGALIVNILLFVSFIVSNSYPVRSSFRFFIVISIALIYLLNTKRKKVADNLGKQRSIA